MGNRPLSVRSKPRQDLVLVVRQTPAAAQLYKAVLIGREDDAYLGYQSERNSEFLSSTD